MYDLKSCVTLRGWHWIQIGGHSEQSVSPDSHYRVQSIFTQDGWLLQYQLLFYPKVENKHPDL